MNMINRIKIKRSARAFRLIGSHCLHSTFLLLTGLCGVCSAFPPSPTLPTYTACYTSGTATCNRVGGVLTITQSSPQLIGAWDTFVIDAGATVHFDQPAGGTALIRIPSGSSQLAGTITATGTVILISPDGIVLNGAQLQGGLVAATLALADADYTAGNLDSSYFTGSTGAVQIGSSGVSGAASGKLRLLAATHAANGPVDLAGFTLGKGVWTQNSPSLPTFSAANFSIDALSGTQFLRVMGGDGTAGTPYVLADIYGLQGVGSSGMGAFSYKLANNIDAISTGTWSRPAGQGDLTNEGFAPIAGFSGILNGDNNTISNLHILNTGAYTGLVGIATGATLSNLTIAGVTVTGSSPRTGGLAGLIEGGTTVSNCHDSGSVTGSNQAGGLVGWSQASSIIDSSSSAVVSGNISVGGLMGDAGAASSIVRCIASGTIVGSQAVGGVVGSVGTGGATISQCATSGAVAVRTGSTGRYIGGILGLGNDATVIVYDINTSPVGRTITVDGINYIAPHSFTWTLGSSHKIIAPHQNESAGSRDGFFSWSDGGAQSHTITVPQRDTTYAATYVTQYQLITSAGIGGSVSPPAGIWYNAGMTPNIIATANSGYAFSGWSLTSGTGPFLNPTSNSTTVAMSGPNSVTATFQAKSVFLSAALGAATGSPGGIRTWPVIITNTGGVPVNTVNLTGLTLSYSGACKPTVTSGIPFNLGNIAAGGSATRNVTVDFSSCNTAKLKALKFSVSIGYSANGGSATGAMGLAGVGQ